MDTLPFTVFEQLMFWEDRPSFPYSVFTRLRFTGRLDRTAVESALPQTLLRHPLLMSKVQSRGTRLHWVLDKPQPKVSWQEVPDRLRDDFPSAPPIDLRHEIGLRAFIAVSQQQSDFVIQFHHSCCDGGGILAFYNDFLILYARERGESSPSVALPNYDPSRLAGRGRFGLNWWKFIKMLPRQLVGLLGVRQFLMRRPTPLIPHTARSSDAPRPAGFPAAVRHEFTVAETNQLRQAAQQQDVSLNDIIVRDLFLALIGWRREVGPANDQDWLRMMIPINLRSAADSELPAANVVSLVFFDRRGVDAANPKQLLTSIHDEMALIKRNELGLTLLFSMQLAQWLPGGLRKMIQTDKCTMSSGLSNLGRLFTQSPLPKRDGQLVVGDTILTGFYALVPLRPYNCVSVAAHQYAERLSLDLHYDCGMITAIQARRIMDLYTDHVLSSMAVNATL